MNFSKILTTWYSAHKRELPWRGIRDPYFVWLSEIILQQTQVKQGLPYYHKFIEAFPTVFDLAAAEEEKVLKLWQGLGYYSRARNLHYTARYIVDECDGKFPTSYNGLIALKGIGDYTASAIASICYDEACAVVDGNVYRLLSRYFGIDLPINSSAGIKKFKQIAQDLLPDKNIGNHNQAIMEFGSRQCKPSTPNCEVCPLRVSCVALKEKKVSDLPIKLKKGKIRKRYFNFLVFLSTDKKTSLEQRKGDGIWKHLYQFPLVETNEPLAIKSFMKNKNVQQILKERVVEFSLFNETDIVHKLSHQHLYIRFWIVQTDTLEKDAISVDEINTYPVPIVIKKFIDNFDF